jgi:uncharacterized protein YbjT (DUF2867 family)
MYAITGATGNTGSVVVKALLAKGRKVRAIGRNAARLRPLTELGAEPFISEVTDREGLSEAFRGARAAYVMLPPNLASPDYRAQQRHAADTLAAAIEEAGVSHVISLSSIGADKAEGTGPVAGLHYLEERLNAIPRLNVVHLRAGYFMENTLSQAGVIQQTGFSAGPLRPELKLPMIATRDIGAAAADWLLRLDFNGENTRELLGQRDLSMNEAVAVIGQAIGKPDLVSIQAPDGLVRSAMLSMGMSGNMADLVLELSSALNSGHARALEARSARNTTPTSYETFVAEEFVPLYKGQRTGA